MQYLLRPVERLAHHLARLRNRHFFVLDVLGLSMAPALALLLRLEDPQAVARLGASLLVLTLAFLVVKIAVFYSARLYHRYWRYASIDELAKITFAVAGAVLLQAVLFFVVLRPFGLIEASFPRSLPFIEGLLALFWVGGTRYSVRLAYRLRQRVRPNGHGRRVLVVGAGTAGVMMVQEMRSNAQLGLHPVAFIDDDPEKQRMRIRSLDVVGTREDLPEAIEAFRVDLVIIAIPQAPGRVVGAIAEVCRQLGVETKTVPGIYELLDDTVSISQLRPVQVEDLLRRAPVPTDRGRLEGLVRGRRVLVTGAGGSIGSELCRQILTLRPAELILLGHGENSIFRIENELRGRLNGARPAVRLHSVIADIRDRPRMEHVFGLYQPEIIFHAAAHKHVPLMEANVEDAVTNNVLGTRNLLELADETATAHFILISTDKAVDPTNAMGATKRIAELLVHDMAARTGRAFLAVRFGNVLGSRGSVLEVFRQQLAQGGPLTVTHPDVRRYFMTIPEAVYLVLQAAAMGRGGELFVLDMGQPVRIVDLARDLIRLSGRRAGEDVEIVFTGLRPGERLDERLFTDDERFERTAHEKILVCNQGCNGGREVGRAQLHWHVDALRDAARAGDLPRLTDLITRLVPTYRMTDAERALHLAPESRGDGGL